MAQTPSSSATPYCTTLRLFDYHDWQQIADLLRDGDNPRPTRMRILDQMSAEGAKVLRVGMAAAGDIESACFVGKRYSAADLAALTGNGAAKLEKLNADLWFYGLMENRQPGSADPDKVPGFARSLSMLEMLEAGERIFSFDESAEAGLPKVSEPDPAQQINPLVAKASPLFGDHVYRNRGLRRRPGC